MTSRFPETYSQLQDKIDPNITESFSLGTKKINWNSFNEILDTDLINTNTVQVGDIKFTIYGGKSLCRTQFCRSKKDNTMYIRWVRVSDKLQGEGIGSVLYQEVCEEFASRESTILVKPVAPGMKTIAQKNNFTSSNQLDEPWFQKCK